MRAAIAITLICIALAGCRQLAPYDKTNTPRPGDDAAHDAPSNDGGVAFDGGAAFEGNGQPMEGGVIIDAAPLSPGAICSVDNWCWENPLPQGNDLLGVWVGAHATYAVGRAGTVLRYDGTSWSGRTGVIAGDLHAVWASTSVDEAWAVGAGGQIVQITATSWRPVVSGSTADLNAVWGDENGMVHAAGAGGALLLYDTTSWNASPRTPTLGPLSDVALNDLWGVSANEIYAVGGANTLLRFDGSAWNSVNGPDNVGSSLIAVCATSDGQLFVANDEKRIYEHTAGSSWRPHDLDRFVSDLWCTTSSEVYAAGIVLPLIRFDGTSWSEVTGSPAKTRAFWGGSTGLGWVVGTDGALSERVEGGWLAHRSGPMGYVSALTGSSANDIWALLGADLLMRWSPTGWSQTTLSFNATPHALWAASATELFAVGESGMAERWDGTQWSSMSTGVSSHLNALWGESRSNLFAAGHTRTLVRFDGTAWYDLSAPTGGPGQTITELWGVGPSEIYAGADKGVLLHYDGNAFQELTQPPPATAAVVTIWGTSTTDIFINGISGEILHFNGAGWSEEPVADGVIVTAIRGVGATEVYAAARDGALVQQIGSSWEARRSGTQNDLFMIWSKDGVSFVGGSNGTILSKRP